MATLITVKPDDLHIGLKVQSNPHASRHLVGTIQSIHDGFVTVNGIMRRESSTQEIRGWMCVVYGGEIHDGGVSAGVLYLVKPTHYSFIKEGI